MSNQEKCPICKKEFGIFRWRYECSECNKIICDDCSGDYPFLKRKVCDICISKIDQEIKKIKVVKSDHIGGHKIIKSFNLVSATHWNRNQQDTVANIKYQAYKLGANSIVSLNIERDTGSEAGSGKGTHYYSIFLASGKPAIAEKNKFTKKNSKQKPNIADEIEKLVKLKEQGHISENDFKKAKNKLLG